MTDAGSSATFNLASFRSVDASRDPGTFVDFLDKFAADFRPMIEAGIEALRLRAGSRVLDVGCGPGAVMPLLAERVGPAGRVAGVDLSRQLVAEAHRRFRGTDLPVEIRVGDAQALDFADASFDAVRADRVLLYVRNARTAILELARVAMAGGRVVVTEFDFGVLAVDSPDPETTRTVFESVSAEFPNAWIGRQLHALFVEAGLAQVEVRLFPVLNRNLAEWSRRLGIDDILRNAVASDLIETARAQAWLDDLRRRDAAGRFLATGMFFMVAGTKPGRGQA
jgi:ubiquinone/menaquinone biosynthesis C-methylase UbiE